MSSGRLYLEGLIHEGVYFQNFTVFIPKNITSITIIITLEGIAKIKTSKNDKTI